MNRVPPSTPIRLSLLALAAAFVASGCGGGGGGQPAAKPARLGSATPIHPPVFSSRMTACTDPKCQL